MTILRRCWPVLAVALLSACVDISDVPGQEGGSSIQGTRPDGQPFDLLDAGAAELDSLHFKVRAYGQDNAKQISEQAETDYNRIMVDTNLYSFQPRNLYVVVVYGSQEEYRRKTGQPEWSGGCSVGNSIYTFGGPAMNQTIAHEMTHLVWFEFMGSLNMDQRWVNEGLAVYEELKAASMEGQRQDPFAIERGALRASPLTLDQLIHLVPATERERTVSLWYAQSEALVQFMIDHGGRIGFSQFLTNLRDNKNFDDAISASFPGVWHSLQDLESAWERSQT